jgi:hypothetical protein
MTARDDGEIPSHVDGITGHALAQRQPTAASERSQ